MDACTWQHHHANYFVINVKYVDKGNIYTKMIAIRDTQAQHSSKLLAQLEKNALQDYGIQKDHVLCTVTYNASNMVWVQQVNK